MHAVLRLLFRVLALLLPARIRARHLHGLVRTFEARVAAAHASRGRLAAVGVALREYVDVLRSAARDRVGDDPLQAAPAATPRAGWPRRVAGVLLADLRFAVRVLRRQPAFTAASVVTLALGIGANVAVFSVVWHVLLAPAPYRDADRLVAAFMTSATSDRGTFSPLDWRDLGARSRTLADLAAYQRATRNLTGAGDPERLSGAAVTSSFFDVLGLAPAAGRWFTPEEARSGAPVIVVDHALWQGRFGGDAGVLGRAVTLNNQAVTIVGVMPEGAALPEDASFWLPLVWDANDFDAPQRGAHFLRLVGRLRAGVTIDQARLDVRAVGDALAAEFPGTNLDASMTVERLRDVQVGGLRPSLIALAGGVALVLLIACSNLANLMLTRGLSRSGEIAVRASLGASRRRLAVQLIVEGVVLAGLGGLVALLLAAWGVRAILLIAPEGLPRLQSVAISAPVLMFLAVLTCATALLFGAIPAWRATRVNLADITREGGTRSVTGGRGLRRGLAVAEVAFAVTLLGTAGLLGRTIAELSAIDPGFDPNHALTFNVTLPSPPYEAAGTRQLVFDRIVERMRALPGVRDATIGYGVPFGAYNSYSSFDIEGIETPEGAEFLANIRIVGDRYFETLDMPLLAGRGFGPADRADSPLVAVISEATARQYFGGADPIGRRLRVHASMASDAPRGYRTVVGVVRDARIRSLTGAIGPEIYMPYAQHAVGSATVVLRTTGEPLAIVPSARRAMLEVDPSLPMAQIRTLDALVSSSVAHQRLAATLLGTFAAIALALAAVGLYGVFSVGVSQRTREIGIRMALGADRFRVLSLFVREGVWLTLIGSALGVIGAVAASKLVESLLVGVSPRDPVTLAAAWLVLTLVSLAASYLPARRAAGMNAAAVLQE